MPFAIQILRNFLSSNGSSIVKFDFLSETDSRKDGFSLLQRSIENEIIKADFNLSIFEVREIIDRYAGLTLEIEDVSNQTKQTENDFFKIADSNNSEIASICNQRRNLKRLSYHQKLAADDFFELILEISIKGNFPQNLYLQLLEFTTTLKDFSMQKEIKKIFDRNTQTTDIIFVNESERNLWKTDQPNSLKNKPLSVSFQTMKATTNLSTKD